MNAKQSQRPESVVREIRRNTRRKYSTEEKIRIVLEGLKGEVSIAELCRREGIVSNLYYRCEQGNSRPEPVARVARPTGGGDRNVKNARCENSRPRPSRS